MYYFIDIVVPFTFFLSLRKREITVKKVYKVLYHLKVCCTAWILVTGIPDPAGNFLNFLLHFLFSTIFCLYLYEQKKFDY